MAETSKRFLVYLARSYFALLGNADVPPIWTVGLRKSAGVAPLQRAFFD